MMDLDSAKKLGLTIQRTDREVHFGSWSGPGDNPQYYVGCVPGPVLVRFDAQVVIPLAEVKLIETSEPLIIVGSDLMALPAVQKGWKFKDIGYDEHDVGTIRFRKCGTHRTRAIPLMAWPTMRPEMSAPRPYTVAPASITHPKSTKSTQPIKPTSSHAAAARRPSAVAAPAPTTRAEAILALIRLNRGQHV